MSENTVPINEEENEKDAVRDPQDTQLGNVTDTENKEAGEAEALQHAVDASTPSFELNVDAGFAEKVKEEDAEPDDSNIKS
jgi:hypothetical protein